MTGKQVLRHSNWSTSDLHKDFALQQLENKILLANMPRKKLENTAVGPFPQG